MSRLFVEAREFSGKGPCSGSMVIPLTDLAELSSPNGLAISSQNMNEPPPSALTRTHENGALVISKFLLESLGNGSEEKVRIPSDRLKVSVKNPSVRVLFEVPSDLSQLEPGQTLTPFAVSVVTSDPTEPPKLKVETGDFGKIQYTADSITLSGTVWDFLKRTQESTDSVVVEGSDSGSEQPTSGNVGHGEDDSIWDEYLESPFFSLRFHFFTSCQVSRDHIFLSVGSASLTEPKVAQLKHRVCLGQLLQDLDMLSVVDSNASRRKAGARFQHALHHRTGDNERHGAASVSNFSQRQTLFSQSSFTSNDDFDGASEPASVYETELADSDADTPGRNFRNQVDRSAVSNAQEDNQLPSPIQTNVRSVERQKSALFF